MEIISLILILSQLFFTIVAGLYFYLNLKAQHGCKNGSRPEYKKEAEHLYKMRSINLTRPLTEKTRPSELCQIIGQEKGIRALRAALCGENPQHILIYGPPGVGKTAASRLILEEAKKSKFSPFKSNAKFIEIDATTLRFDERSIADPLIGSVHDPIYQGAGALGTAGIPQPKEGAVTRAHGGVLFIDEIGELNPIQMNKLLKVLEDRCVYFTSSYYNREDKSMPKYIKDIFENGLPADFRLIGATTRSPEDIPPALRSRCTEIFFNSLSREQIEEIGENACVCLGAAFESGIPQLLSQYCSNGRAAVNLVQSAYAYAETDGRFQIKKADLEEAVVMSRLSPRYIPKINPSPKIGYVNGLGVSSGGEGIILGIEASAEKVDDGKKGSLKITGIINEETLNNKSGSVKRKSNAQASVENALTVIKNYYKTDYNNYNIHINFPGGIPVDGPSAGIAVFTCLYSALTRLKVSNTIAMTGEIGIYGDIRPVGGVREKLEAAKAGGAALAVIPKENMNDELKTIGIDIIAAENTDQLIEAVFGSQIFDAQKNDAQENNLAV